MVSPVNQQPQVSQENKQAYEIVTGPDGRRYEKRSDGIYPEGHKSLYPGEGRTFFVVGSSTPIATKSMGSATPVAVKGPAKK